MVLNPAANVVFHPFVAWSSFSEECTGVLPAGSVLSAERARSFPNQTPTLILSSEFNLRLFTVAAAASATERRVLLPSSSGRW